MSGCRTRCPRSGRTPDRDAPKPVCRLSSALCKPLGNLDGTGSRCGPLESAGSRSGWRRNGEDRGPLGAPRGSPRPFTMTKGPPLPATVLRATLVLTQAPLTCPCRRLHVLAAHPAQPPTELRLALDRQTSHCRDRPPITLGGRSKDLVCMITRSGAIEPDRIRKINAGQDLVEHRGLRHLERFHRISRRRWPKPTANAGFMTQSPAHRREPHASRPTLS